MNLGHNSNVHVGGTAYHVQTEDRGSGHPFIDTTVYAGGRVVHRRTTTYADLLNTNDRQLSLQKRVEEQHRAVIDEIRSGILELPLSPLVDQNSANTPLDSGGVPGASSGKILTADRNSIIVTLINPSSWISVGNANLQIEVRARETSEPKASATILVTLEGALSPTEFQATTNIEGYAEIKFPLPKMSADGATLVIHASSGTATDQIRYHLKSKPRTPASSASVP